MLRRLKDLFSGSEKPTEIAPDEQAIAIAALLVEAAVADENYAEAERRVIGELLVGEFGVAREAVENVISEAEERQRGAVDLHRFTREAKGLPADAKIALIEALWRVILTDGEKDSFEDMLVRRVCGLIHVSDVDSGLARQRVQSRLG